MVTAIDSINTLNGWMKRFQISGSTTSPYLVEGMGHYNGLTEPIDPNTMSCEWDLQCYSQSGSRYYPNSSGGSCMIDVGISESKALEKYLVYPNPSPGTYSLQLNNGFDGAVFEVYNTLGEKIITSQINDERTSVDITSQPAGVYFLKIRSGDKQNTIKLVKE